MVLSVRGGGGGGGRQGAPTHLASELTGAPPRLSGGGEPSLPRSFWTGVRKGAGSLVFVMSSTPLTPSSCCRFLA